MNNTRRSGKKGANSKSIAEVGEVNHPLFILDIIGYSLSNFV